MANGLSPLFSTKSSHRRCQVCDFSGSKSKQTDCLPFIQEEDSDHVHTAIFKMGNNGTYWIAENSAYCCCGSLDGREFGENGYL